MTEGNLERREDVGKGPSGAVKFWRAELEKSHKDHRDWEKRADKVVERYRGEKRAASTRRFNILWANTETLKPAVYSQRPQPDVRRRYLDEDPVGRDAAEILERALSFCMDDYDFDGTIEGARDDMLLPGRGVVRVAYEPTLVKRAVDRVMVPSFDDETGEFLETEVFALDGAEIEPDGFEDDEPFIEELADQRVWMQYVYWKDYRESPARRWEDVRWVAFRHQLTRDELVETFGPGAKDIKLTLSTDDADDKGKDAPQDTFMRACVWEIWDKVKREQVFIADGHGEVLETNPDPLGLQDFFPVPSPLYAVKTNDTRRPIPEFTLYQDQAIELDELSTRKKHLIRALKARGVYAGVLTEVQQLISETGENQMIAVKDWAAFRDKGGLEKAIEWMPIETVARVLVSLNDEISKLKGEIFEVTGISDLLRGDTKASETATAQRIKGSFGTMRLQPRQAPMQAMIRDGLRLKAEIIAEHFQPDTIARMTGKEVTPEILALLRDEKARGFRIDIETDSTVQPDAEMERKNATEFLAASTQFWTGIAPLIAQAPQAAPMFMEMYKQAVRSFKHGRTLEEVINQVAEQIKQQAAQPQQQGPSAEQQAAEAKAQEAQMNAEIKAQEMQTDAALRVREQDMNAELSERQLGIDALLRQAEIESRA